MTKLRIFFFAFMMVAFASYAQQSEAPDIKGWLDDDTYLQEIINDEGVAQIWKVNVKNGKSRIYQKQTPKDKVNEMLPDGYRINYWTSTSTEDYEKNIFNQQSDLFYFDAEEEEFRQLTENEDAEENPSFSQDESKIAFTRNNNLFMIDLETGEEKQLTFDGSDLILNGYASWVYWEEIFGRATRYKVFWWSPDSKKIAFLQFNDEPVPEFLIYNSEGTHGEWEKTRYPKAGDPNPGVKLGIIDVDSGNINWIADNENEDIYIAFPKWTHDSQNLTYQVLNRDQDHLEIFKYNLPQATTQKIYDEQQKTWIEFFSDIHFLEDGSGFIVRSDKDGWRNLYYYDMDGNLISKLTDNDWRLKELLKVDTENGWVYFLGTGENPINREIFKVRMDGSDQQKLSSYEGYHSADISPDGSYIIDKFSSFHTPTTIEIIDNEGNTIRSLYAKEPADPEENELCEVEYFTIPTEDGFELPAYWELPPDFDPDEKYGVIFRIYGGPDHPGIRNRYVNPKPGFFAKNDIITFVVDHRGSGHFGKEGLNYVYRNLGMWELKDYIAAVDWLKAHSFIDPDKIGITGGSYGGYMTCLALTKGAEHFTHGYGSSAVTSWRLYDDVYTERYMDHPEDNPEGYDTTSVMHYADKLKGKLYITHGDMDDNVHLQNMIQLVDKLTDLNKDFEMMIYPGGRHGWGPPKVYHTKREMEEFWKESFQE
ncbi:MAG: S9 family peptidase [Bacteroidales bacterium]|nr:S9 family peptidase [Bacteroidales bacterium]MCF8386611.1 S9 family peptidase [Bacteroidales bacterium]MCF8397727.1 S9 family peptidase [Bacteroidales bacterium]